MKQVVEIAAMILASCLILANTVWSRTAASHSIEMHPSTALEQRSTPHTDPGAKSSLATKLDQYMDQVTAESGFSGSVLVAKRDRVLLQKGYGWADRQKTSRVALNTKFYIASITKQFTAAAILKLEEQGHLSLKDPISKYFRDVPPDKAGITIHQLLTHTAGLIQNYAADGISDRDEAVRAVLKQPLKNKPGEQFGYGNDGYSLLAAIVEIVSGQTYESFLRRYLLQPAGMFQTGFWGDSPAKGEQPIAQTLSQIDTTPNWGFRGGVGMSSTVGDLYKWHRALLANRVLSKTGREKLLTPYVSTTRGSYTYGWFISKTSQGLQVIWTAGLEDFGHNAIIKIYGDGTVVIVASNAGSLSGTPARDLASAGLERIVFDSDVTGVKGAHRH